MSLPACGLYGLFNKRQEVRPIAGRCALPVDLAGGDVQGGEEVCGAVSEVVVGRFLGRVEGDQQQRLRPVQRLDLRLFVQTEHHCSTRRVQIQPDDVGDFGGKLGIAAELERALTVRAQSVLAPQCRHVMVRHIHPLGAPDEHRHLPARPVRQTRLRWRTDATGRQNPSPNRPRHLLSGRPTPPIQQPTDPLAAVAIQPQIHRRPRHPRQSSDLLLGSHLRMPQHDPRPRGHRRRHVRTVQQPPQLGPLIHRQLHQPSQQQDKSNPCKENRITNH